MDNCRKFQGLGLFRKKSCDGSLVRHNPFLVIIYNKLKELGFKETKWQYIYEGQIGALVKQHNNGGNEIHVRFYSDRIFAEFEIGRAYFLHFIGPRYNANEHIVNILKPLMNSNDRELLLELMHSKRLKNQERCMEFWAPPKDPHKKYKFIERLVELSFVSTLFSWKALILLLIGLSLLFFEFRWWAVLPLFISFPVFKMLPSRSNPNMSQ